MVQAHLRSPRTAGRVGTEDMSEKGWAWVLEEGVGKALGSEMRRSLPEGTALGGHGGCAKVSASGTVGTSPQARVWARHKEV